MAGIKHWRQRIFCVSLTMHFQLFTGLLKVSFWKPCNYLSWTGSGIVHHFHLAQHNPIPLSTIYPSNSELLIFIPICVVKQSTCGKMCVRYTLQRTVIQFRRIKVLLFSEIAIEIFIFWCGKTRWAFLTTHNSPHVTRNGRFTTN